MTKGTPWTAAPLVSACMAGAAGAETVEELLAAAKGAPPMTTYAVTSTIVGTAEALSVRNGMTVTSKKVNQAGQADLLIREAQNPPLVVNSPNIIAYDTALHAACPTGNMWELTLPEWNNKFAMQDPLGKPSGTDCFNQTQTQDDDKLRAADEARFGKPPETEFASATEAFVAALAATGPLLIDSGSAAGEAVAAPGQTETFLGLMSAAKFRDNAEAGFTLGLCGGIDPFIGFTNSTVVLVTAGTDSPNAARLFIHYVMAAAGIAPQTEDRNISSCGTVALPADEPSGISAHLEEVQHYNPASGLSDWDTRQDWQDFWQVNYQKLRANCPGDTRRISRTS